MNKKIWIGLASVFLILVLVLGFQMRNKEPALDSEENQANETNPYETKQPTTNTNQGNQSNIETQEAETEEGADPEIPEEPEQPIEPETPTESPIESPEQTTESDAPAPIEQTPTPEAWGQKEPSPLFVTLSVSAKTLLDKKDVMNQEKVELVPKDGWIFPPQKVEFYEGESAFNVLLREMKKNKIHMEYVMTPIYNSNYIEGIGNLYEFDCGELSGWMYAVNDSSPSLGTTNYILKDGDVVRLLYTCDLGRDIGFEFNE